MNTDMIEGDWTTLKGKIRETWGKLTDDDLDVIAGKRDQLIGKIQHRYGRSKEDIVNEISRFEQKSRNENWQAGTLPG